MQAVWFSASGDLAMDASRDFKDVGALKYDPVRIHNLRKLKIPRSGKIADVPGALCFCYRVSEHECNVECTA